MKEKKYTFDVAYTSVLKRAVHTCWAVLKETDQAHVPVINSWRLNERHYGALQGLNKAETAAKHGDEQVKIWRRSYAVPPPAVDVNDERWPGNNSVYARIPKDVLPTTECLKDTVERGALFRAVQITSARCDCDLCILCVLYSVLPLWFDHIAPDLLEGRRVLVAAHGNSLRGLVKHLDKMCEEDVLNLNIPTGVPLVYELDASLKPIRHYYLMNEQELQAKMDAVANQGKAKN